MDKLAQKTKSSTAGDIAFGAAIAAAGLVIAGVSFMHVGDRPHVMAQATQTAPVEAAPTDATKSSPVEPVRPTTPAPQPARPDADAQKAGAQPALPPAPAEKVGEPVPERK